MSERRSVLNPRYPILGAIRIGERVDTGKVDKKTGKPISRPKRLETFRLTSPNPTLLAAASKHYGGEVTEWNDAPGGRQWQLYTKVNCLSVTVPPDESYQQAYEQYDQYGECILQCDGETITHAQNKDLIGNPCDHDAEHIEFDLYTRLKVILHNIPSSMGVWQIRTKGYYSGSELIAMAPFLENAASNGAFLDCTLRVEMRKKRTEGQNRFFPVIGIQPAGVTFQQLLQGQIPDTALIAPIAGRIRQIQAAQEEADLTDDERYAAIMADHPEWAEPDDRPMAQQNVTTVPQQPPRFVGVNPETGEMDEPEPETEPEDEPMVHPVHSEPSEVALMTVRQWLQPRLDDMTAKQRAAMIKSCGGGDATLANITDMDVLTKLEQLVVAREKGKPQETGSDTEPKML